MRRTHDSEPGPAGGTEELKTMEDRYFHLLMNRLDRIEAAQDASNEGRRRLYEKIDLTDRTLERVSIKVETLEKTLSSVTPTIQEFMTYKHQVIGAGRFGRALWWLGGLILAAASGAVSYFYGKGSG